MIKRNASKTTDSLVNTSQNEHFNIAEGIRTDVPITNTRSVVKSINFINEPDGSCILRPPLILKEAVTPNTWYLYDKEHILSISSNGTIAITNPNDGEDIAKITLRYFDKTIKLNSLNFSNNSDYIFAFLSKIISVNTFNDYTLLSVKINLNTFKDYITQYNLSHTTSHDPYLVYDDSNYSSLDNNNVYRLIKIYQDTDSKELSWIIEIVHPELNTITSSTSTESVLDVNLLLDNPYAVRDLYGYGYISTTKILPYVPFNYSYENEIKEHTVCKLTESIPVTINNTLKGYKLLVSSSPKSLGMQPLILKAFLTTAKTNSVYYGVWEESSNEGLDWKVCPEFISKFENHPTNPLVTKHVSDLTSEEFEKIAYQESLEQATSYLVEKKLVRLNYKTADNQPEDLSETDLIKDRPDVLYIQAPNLSKRYRFQVYIDTLKETPTASHSDKNYTIYTFTTLDGDVDPDYATYSATSQQAYSGVKYTAIDENTGQYNQNAPELDANCIVLYPPSDGHPNNTTNLVDHPSYFGNAIKIDCVKRSPDSYIKKVIITVGKNDCYLNAVLSSSSSYIFVPVAKFVEKNTQATFEFEKDSSTNTIYIFNRGVKDVDNKAAAYIVSIKVVYALEGVVESTSVYLASSTGMFQVPYSEKTVFADLLENERRVLFSGKTFEYEHQILLFNKYNLFSSNVDSTIFSAMKTLTFSTEIVNVINWRSYLLVFTEKDVSLIKYDYSTNSYNLKVLSNSIGIPKKDAKTVVCILNSVYFKSGYKIYRLVPNLYAAVDDILNLHTVSDSIDSLIETLLSSEIETQNFVYANAYRYYLFVPLDDHTYCFVYDYTRKIWNLFDYPVKILSIENLGLSEEYLKTSSGLYYFKDRIDTLLNTELLYHPLDIAYIDTSDEQEYGVCTDIDGEFLDVCIQSDTYSHMTSLIPRIPYVDFLDKTLKNIYLFLENSNVVISDDTYEIKDTTTGNVIQMTPIEYLIDFGQKSSNYTLYKTFLETKMTLATLSEKDTFPFEVYITTDGIENPLHWDVNTDSALWKNSFSHKGTVGTLFTTDNSEYNGIMRQLIVKYSGRGKTIHQVLKGKSKYNFKFYSMDVRSRILPKKQ